MYTLSHSILVNPENVAPVLTSDQVWRGLVMKVENAIPFVKGMTQCDLIERRDNTVLREITFAGKTHKELITLYEPVKVHFHRVDESGWIDNVISDSEVGMLLTFTFGLVFPGTEPNSDAERAKGDEMRGAYVGAVEATLGRVRQLVADGEL